MKTCTFCGNSEKYHYLVTGQNDSHICADCIEIANKIIANRKTDNQKYSTNEYGKQLIKKILKDKLNE